MKKTRSGKQRGAKLGQHFLTGIWAAAKLAESASITSDDTVLEIGPGKGALTRELLKTGARVIAVEKDRALIPVLEALFPAELRSGRLMLFENDVREFSPEDAGLTSGSYVLAANIPYYITGEILRIFLTSRAQPKTIAVLVQKEVAERIARSAKESILSLSVKAYGAARITAKVGRGNFSPPPAVDSAILVVERVTRSFFRDTDEDVFFRVVRAGFASKRKLLAGNLRVLFGKDDAPAALAACGIAPKARAEDVPLEQWGALARFFSAKNPSS